MIKNILAALTLAAAMVGAAMLLGLYFAWWTGY